MSDVLMIRCAVCGATNRVPSAKLHASARPKCGRCKAALNIDIEPLNVASSKVAPLIATDASFAREIEGSPLPVLVDAWAPWCGPCRIIAPVIEELAVEWAGRVRVAKLNVDENPATAARFELRSIPTLLVLKNGKEVDRMVGVQPKAEIVRRLQRHAARV